MIKKGDSLRKPVDVNTYATNNRASEFMKQRVAKLSQREK